MGGGGARGRRGLRIRRGAAMAALAATLLCATPVNPASAAGVKDASPYWFQDSYRTTAYVAANAASAIVDTAGTGTVYLPPLSGDALAYAPPYVGADIVEVATATGVRGWGFNGSAMVREPFLNIPVANPSGIAFLGPPPPGDPALGVRVAVATAAGITVYAWNGATWAGALAVPASGVIGVAAGARGGMVAATTTSFTLYSPAGTAVTAVTGLSGIRGVTASASGGLVGVWTASAVSFYAWDGAAYVPLPSWTEPPPSGGTILGAALFANGTGYWVATPTQVIAYGWDGAGLAPLSAWASSAIPATPVAVAAGWGAGSVALLSPSGIHYLDPYGGSMGSDTARSVLGRTWPVFATSGVLQSTVLPVGQPVDEVKMVDTLAALPSGAAVTYRVSTDGGTSWTDVPPDTPTTVPAGESLVYQAVLSTTNQAATPILDTTNLYQILTETITPTTPPAVTWLLP